MGAENGLKTEFAFRETVYKLADFNDVRHYAHMLGFLKAAADYNYNIKIRRIGDYKILYYYGPELPGRDTKTMLLGKTEEGLYFTGHWQWDYPPHVKDTAQIHWCLGFDRDITAEDVLPPAVPYINRRYRAQGDIVVTVCGYSAATWLLWTLKLLDRILINKFGIAGGVSVDKNDPAEYIGRLTVYVEGAGAKFAEKMAEKFAGVLPPECDIEAVDGRVVVTVTAQKVMDILKNLARPVEIRIGQHVILVDAAINCRMPMPAGDMLRFGRRDDAFDFILVGPQYVTFKHPRHGDKAYWAGEQLTCIRLGQTGLEFNRHWLEQGFRHMLQLSETGAETAIHGQPHMTGKSIQIL